jgi:hypothetical protein
MYPHRIRLRGPWQCEPLRRRDDAEQPLPPPRRMTMPCHWSKGGLADFTGRVRLRRAFGYPGRLDAYERVWLTFAGVGGEAEAWLNEHPLGRIGTGSQFEITPWLNARNALIVEIDGTAEEGGLWGEAALEIRCTAFLCDLRHSAILTGDRVDLQVTGRVVGTAEQPLDLYCLLDGSVLGYMQIRPTDAGEPFAFVGEEISVEKWRDSGVPVQVDLVNGAVVWYTYRDETRLDTANERSK